MDNTHRITITLYIIACSILTLLAGYQANTNQNLTTQNLRLQKELLSYQESIRLHQLIPHPSTNTITLTNYLTITKTNTITITNK